MTAPQLSADGRFVVFDSNATNILSGTGNCGITFECVFMRDMCTGVERLVAAKSANAPAGQ